MFRKTKFELVSLFTLVFFIVLTILGFSLYLFMERISYSSIDDRLRHKESFLVQNSNEIKSEEKERETERKVTYLFWDEKGNLLKSFPEKAFYSKELASLKPTNDDKKVRTKSIGGHTYRILKHKVKKSEPKKVPSSATVQLVYNIDPEEKVLKKLLLLIAFGSVIGLAISFVAGLFLANKALIPIQRSWEKQVQFVGDASHELRTPLAIIQTQLERLFRHPTRTIEEEITSIYNGLSEVKRLSKLVGDLLTLARYDSNEQQINPSSFAMDNLLESLVEQFQPIADMKELKLKKSIEKNIYCFGDKERIHQLFVILLDNAIKYSHQCGQILVMCKREGSGHLTIKIKDNGKGISEDDLPYIFDRFYRSEKERNRSTGGSGLGLSIAK
ncbi:sensor histidine kinase [Falsibacillus pallidus]|uniref:sensor histidine kinase n=1 Tax=Falsibacillus pallidus TaxID=493781 RepID=UPI003D97CA9C